MEVDKLEEDEAEPGQLQIVEGEEGDRNTDEEHADLEEFRNAILAADSIEGAEEEEEEEEREEDETPRGFIAEDCVLEDGRTLSQFLADAHTAGLVELWEHGRLAPVEVPLESIQPFYSVKGFQGLVQRMCNNITAPLSGVNCGLQHYFNRRASLTTIPCDQSIDLLTVSQALFIFFFNQRKLEIFYFDCSEKELKFVVFLKS
jgi:hypothetical protein